MVVLYAVFIACLIGSNVLVASYCEGPQGYPQGAQPPPQFSGAPDPSLPDPECVQMAQFNIQLGGGKLRWVGTLGLIVTILTDIGLCIRGSKQSLMAVPISLLRRRR